MAQNPTFFAEKREAKIEASGRLTVMRVKRAVERQVAEGKFDGIPERLEILDGLRQAAASRLHVCDRRNRSRGRIVG